MQLVGVLCSVLTNSKKATGHLDSQICNSTSDFEKCNSTSDFEKRNTWNGVIRKKKKTPEMEDPRLKFAIKHRLKITHNTLMQKVLKVWYTWHDKSPTKGINWPQRHQYVSSENGIDESEAMPGSKVLRTEQWSQYNNISNKNGQWYSDREITHRCRSLWCRDLSGMSQKKTR